MPEEPTRERLPAAVRQARPEFADPTWIGTLAAQLRQRYDARNTTIEKLRKLRFMQHDVPIPPAYKQDDEEPIRTYALGKSIETAVGALTGLWPNIHVPLPPQPAGADLANASARERFLSAYLRRLNEQEGSRDFFRLLLDSMIAEGVGVLKATYTPKAWQAMPQLRTFLKDRDYHASLSDAHILADFTPAERDAWNAASEAFVQNAPLPFRVRPVDVLTYFPVRGEFGTDAVLEITQRPLVAARRQASVWGGLPVDEREPLTEATVTLYEYWDDQYMALWASLGGEHRLVGAMAHGHLRLPYFESMGQVTSSADPQFEAISTPFKLQYTIPHVDRLLNIAYNVAHLTGYPHLQQNQRSLDEKEDPAPLELTPGQIYTYDSNVGEGPVETLQVQANSADVHAMTGLLLSLSDASGMGAAASGQGRFSGDSGFLQAQLTELAKTGYHQVPEHAGWALSALCRWMLQMIDGPIGRTLWVDAEAEHAGRQVRQWIGLGPDQINGYTTVDVQVRPFNPVMDIARGTHFTNMRERGMIPWRRALELSGYEQPEALMEEVLMDKLVEVPALQAAIINHALERAGIAAPPDEAAGAAGPAVDPQVVAAAMGVEGGRPPGSPAVPGVGVTLNANNNQPGAVPIEPEGGAT